jgi:Ni,Fe-hydrogenase III small subunit
MAGPLRRTFDAMPEPRVVIAAGTDAISGGLVYPSYAAGPGIESIVPVDVWVPGSPPSPFSLLHGILAGIGLVAVGSSA